MQRMASLKPMMEELKVKYGKDKERLNQEMMNLYKREKVNPLGGCLPMLLQMPIWIALYRTIYSAVDLYQAPLGLWITDLSAPDPYFVLPLVLGVSMFVQQKLSPTTMDSAQAKMMLYMMPAMFTVFMLFLPSGLNLYILVNTVLSLAQQWYLKKKLSPSPALKAA
jgi:YidC/Oxa1 family membrane protein insertase